MLGLERRDLACARPGRAIADFVDEKVVGFAERQAEPERNLRFRAGAAARNHEERLRRRCARERATLVQAVEERTYLRIELRAGRLRRTLVPRTDSRLGAP